MRKWTEKKHLTPDLRGVNKGQRRMLLRVKQTTTKGHNISRRRARRYFEKIKKTSPSAVAIIFSSNLHHVRILDVSKNDSSKANNKSPQPWTRANEER